ncbi:MAG: hypothetical protein H0V85_05750 [Thermoleophilaceae bacterium]|nr:hypothetical protein [Thermoleophilaceae bacterium]
MSATTPATNPETRPQTPAAAPREVPAWISRYFWASSAINFVVAGPGVISPRRSAELIGDRPPSPEFPTRAWSGMAVMFGFMFQEIARDPLGKRAMIRYGWAEKLVSATATTIGYRRGEAPRSLMATIAIADWAQIIPFIYAKYRLDQIADEEASGG